jgi:hypothetical protein
MYAVPSLAAGFASLGAAGPNLQVFSQTGPKASGRPFLATDVLYKETGVPVWGLLPDQDDGLYVRVVEPGYLSGRSYARPALLIDLQTAPGG